MRAAGEKAPQRPTDQRAFVLDYIDRARAKGDTTNSDAELSVAGAERYLEQSRPVQPNVAIPGAVTARMKDDYKLQQLDIAAMKARNDPEKLKVINDQITARIKEIEQDVMGQASQGRGTGGGGGGGGAANPPSVRQPLPMPRSAADAVVGQIYNTARGPAKWDGKQFILAQ
jgi:hypothetical protein